MRAALVLALVLASSPASAWWYEDDIAPIHIPTPSTTATPTITPTPDAVITKNTDRPPRRQEEECHEETYPVAGMVGKMMTLMWHRRTVCR